MGGAQALGIPAADADTLKAFQKLVDQLSNMGAFAFGFTEPALGTGAGARGIPVAIRGLGKKPPPVLSLKQVSPDPVAAEDLAVPKRYMEAVIPLPSG